MSVMWQDAEHERLPTRIVTVAEPAGELPAGFAQWPSAAASGSESVLMKKPLPDIQITRFDKKRLRRLLEGLDALPEGRPLDELERELERGIEVDSIEVAPDVVTMNSTVRFTDLDTNVTQTCTIVFPADADVERGRISILSPLGTALLGFRAGDLVVWEMPDGTRRFRIDALIYQPEAAGDFHL